ncbi:MAG: pyridoxal-phosphate dependent enzyme, partial [Chloroflexota bacterium]|nr:pyridoxal-phosphate dependent enzyme [Chloroflexota bacterium]
CEQMDFEVPDYVAVPTSSGGNIRGVLKGSEEFRLCGLTRKVPEMICVQAGGCSPIYDAYNGAEETISRVASPHTIAHAIENPYPPSGNEVLRRLRGGRGPFVTVTDEEILWAQRRLATEGIFAQPASAAPLAAVGKLRSSGVINGNAIVVCIVTGSGLKYTAALAKYEFRVLSGKLADLSDLLAV